MGYKKISIYIGGSIRNLDAQGVLKKFNGAESYIKDKFKAQGIECNIYSPVRGKYVDETSKKWKPTQSLKAIIARDETDIRKSDVLILLTGDHPSDGSWLEFGLAIYECKIPVVMVAPKRKNNELISWSNEKATFLGENLEECVDWLIDYWMA